MKKLYLFSSEISAENDHLAWTDDLEGYLDSNDGDGGPYAATELDPDEVYCYLQDRHYLQYFECGEALYKAIKLAMHNGVLNPQDAPEGYEGWGRYYLTAIVSDDENVWDFYACNDRVAVYGTKDNCEAEADEILGGDVVWDVCQYYGHEHKDCATVEKNGHYLVCEASYLVEGMTYDDVDESEIIATFHFAAVEA